MRYTPENIQSLFPNEVFVYGSNQYAQHGGGAARVAKERFGATNGDCPIGLCGNSYGIITTSFNDTKITESMIRTQLILLYQFGRLRPDLIFYVTKIGTGIAGIPIEQMAGIFKSISELRPINIILPKEFTI